MSIVVYACIKWPRWCACTRRWDGTVNIQGQHYRREDLRPFCNIQIYMNYVQINRLQHFLHNSQWKQYVGQLPPQLKYAYSICSSRVSVSKMNSLTKLRVFNFKKMEVTLINKSIRQFRSWRAGHTPHYMFVHRITFHALVRNRTFQIF